MNGKRKIEERTDIVKSMYENDMDIEQIAKIVKISVKEIEDILKEEK